VLLCLTPLTITAPARSADQRIVPPTVVSLQAAPAPVAPGPVSTAPIAAPLTLTLADAIHLALEKNPRIAAQSASLAAVEDGRQALDNLRAPGLLVPELPIRRRQADLGVTAASAAVEIARHEVVYAVTRTYLSVLYAREQERVTRGVVDRLTAVRTAADDALKAGSREATTADVSRTTAYLRLAEIKNTQAKAGVLRARAALKEAIGLGPDCCVEVVGDRLPVPTARPCLGEIVAAALARRGELIQANIFAEVVCLEIEAQGTSFLKRMETFASGSDIHGHQVPPGIHNNEYLPGAVPPEMPVVLVGSKGDRVKHAQSLHARALAVVDTTRNLITLEAEDAWLRWDEAARQVRQGREGADAGNVLAKDLDKQRASGLKVRVEDVVNAHVLASQSEAQYNEALFHELLALADLERITAGTFCAGILDAAPRAEKPANGTNGGK
jgi:outer membrane protein TolC